MGQFDHWHKVAMAAVNLGCRMAEQSAIPAMPTATATDRTATIARAIRHAARGEAVSFTVTARGEAVSFTSRLSDDAAMDLLQYCAGRFAASLWQQSHERRLSPAQMAWAHKLATDLLQAESAESENSGEPQFSRLFDTFRAAKARGLKRLTLRLSGVNVKPNRDLTTLWVTSQTETEEGNYGPQPKYLGKITPNRLDSRLADEVKAVLLEAADDPLTAAVRYGKETGSCSCCGRDLTNPGSIAAGIGPICREKYGL